MRYDMILHDGFSITKTPDLAAAAVEVRLVVFDNASVRRAWLHAGQHSWQ
jgi:hypothetical protein